MLHDLIQTELSRLQTLLAALDPAQLTQAAELMEQVPGKLVILGNGGSNAIASHMAEDYTNNYKATLCCSDTAMLSCFANDFGWEQAFVTWLQHFAKPQEDGLILISSSGASRNILNCATWAQEHKMPLITLSGFQSDNPLRQCGSVAFYVPSSSYKDVEVLHLVILHTILESLIKKGVSHAQPQ